MADDDYLMEASSSSSLREWVVAFYEAHNPEKLGSVDLILAKFAGKEEELVRQLERKYAKPESTEVGALRRQVESLRAGVGREQRLKDEALRRLGAAAAAEARERQQAARWAERAKEDDRRAASAACEAAAATLAAAAKHRRLLGALAAENELQAHLEAALRRAPGDDAPVVESAMRREVAAEARDRARAEARVVELSKRCRALEDELGDMRRRLERASGSAADARESVERARREARAATDARDRTAAQLAAEVVRSEETARRLRDTEAALGAAYDARRLLDAYFRDQRQSVEAAARNKVTEARETYAMLQADLLSRDAALADLHQAARDHRLVAARDDLHRLSRAMADLQADRDATRNECDRLRAELRKAAQRILQAEALLNISNTKYLQHHRNGTAMPPPNP